MKKKALPVLALTLIMLLCAACGSRQFTVIDGDSCREVTLAAGESIAGPALIYTLDGDVFYAEDYRPDRELTGAILDPPGLTQMDVYELTKKVFDKEGRALLIYIDGLGWDRFQQAVDDGDLPVLSTLSAARAAAMYPTITPVNYAAMVTGRPPAVNGVNARGIHDLSCPSIFTYCSEQGLTSYAAEGDIRIIAFPETELELNPDLNGDGTGDDEILDCALAAVNDHDFVFVHFHSLDDTEHEFGPGSRQAREALIKIDSWCGQLLAVWDGPVVVASDHGQHDNDGSGDAAYADRSGTHGDFRPSDIFVPILIR
ncbi:MAG: alkaline phosphatase family protein [Firmicutes bacterium]|nr:alkaline phosphatase family protein [Bacillota bacterium]